MSKRGVSSGSGSVRPSYLAALVAASFLIAPVRWGEAQRGCAAPISARSVSEEGESTEGKVGQAKCSQLSAEHAFLSANHAAMDKMMANMMIRATGNIDHDFVAMMVPHHQGAIDMAALELRYGHNERLKAIAQEILITQRQEVAAMRLSLGESPPGSKSGPSNLVVPPGP